MDANRSEEWCVRRMGGGGLIYVRLAMFLLLLVVLSRRGHLLNKERASGLVYAGSAGVRYVGLRMACPIINSE